MRRLPVSLAVVLAAASSAALLAATDVNLNVPISSRSMNSDLWSDFDTQVAAGATVDLARHGAPIHFAIGTQTSMSTKSFTDPLSEDTRASISEISFGLAKVWETKGSTRPFLGGGASFVTVEMEQNVILGTGIDRDRDDSIGFYVEAQSARLKASDVGAAEGGIDDHLLLIVAGARVRVF